MGNFVQSISSGFRFSKLMQTTLLAALMVLALVLNGCDLQGSENTSQPLHTPSQVSPADGEETGNAVLMEWDSIDPLLEYRIQVALVSDFTTLVTDEIVRYRPMFAMADLTMNGVYYWRVRAELDGDVSQWSTPREFRVKRFTRPPTSPRLAEPQNGEQGLERTLRLEWEPVEGAYAYHLVVTLDEDMYIHQADLDSITDPFFDLDRLVLTYPYWWKVRALGPAGWSDWSPVWIFWIRNEE
jgi:hypothetical protein